MAEIDGADSWQSSLSDQELAALPLLGETQLDYPLQQRGKVRDIYQIDGLLGLLSSDRQSAFDRQLAVVPLKGWALTQQSAWWFRRCADIIAHHLQDVVAGRILLVRPCRVVPIEVVVRGYLSGSTSTSIWRQYQSGRRHFGDLRLANGLRKNSRLAHPIITPTTKEVEHDRPLEDQQVASLVGLELWQRIKERALALFARGTQLAATAGLRLIDTKYEFGLDQEGELLLVDELHSGDSSRFCPLTAESWTGADHLDKEYLRLWLSDRCDPYQRPIPTIPAAIVLGQAQRHLCLYEKLTGLRARDQLGALPLTSEEIATQLRCFLTGRNR